MSGERTPAAPGGPILRFSHHVVYSADWRPVRVAAVWAALILSGWSVVIALAWLLVTLL